MSADGEHVRVATEVPPDASGRAAAGPGFRHTAGSSRPHAGDSLATPQRLHSLFHPQGIAIVGASDTSLWSRNLYGNLTRLPFHGPVVPVHPRHRSTFGIPNRRSLREVDEPVDLAVLLVPTHAVEAVLDDAAAAGIRNVIVVAAGFGEQDDQGRAREERLQRMAVERGLTLLGPNCPGFVNAAVGVAPYGFALGVPLLPGPAAAVLQSGALASAVLAYARGHGVGISLLVSLGNESIIRTADVLDYLLDDAETRVIALFLEAIRDGARFLAAAERARARGKALVVMKVGRTPLGQRATLSHTGAIAGDDAVIEAALRQAGVIRVQSLEELLVTAGLMARQRPSGRRMGVVTFSGGACDIIADRASDEGIEIPDFSARTSSGLREFLPSFARPANPLDVTGFQLAEVRPRMPITQALEVVAEDPGLDFVLYMGVPAPEQVPAGREREQVEARAAQVAAAISAAKIPVLLISQTDAQLSDYVRDLYARHGLYVLAGLELGMRAVGHAVRWDHARRGQSAVWDGAFRGNRVSGPLHAPDRGRGWSEMAAREALAAGGVPVVPGILVRSAAGAVEAAERLGYPVVLKVCSAQLAHKSDIGGVMLNVPTRRAVLHAYAQLRTVAGSLPQADVEGVLVTPMRTGGVELIAGVTVDPTFGPVLALGLGGLFVEVLDDVQLRLLPVQPPEVMEMLRSLRGWPLFQGARGRPPVDGAAVAEAVTRLSRVALRLGSDLEAVEANPLWCRGDQAEVLDALVIMASPAATAGEGQGP